MISSASFCPDFAASRSSETLTRPRIIAEAQAAAKKLGLEADVLAIRPEAIAPVFETFDSRVQALYVCPDPLINANHARINARALGARLLLIRFAIISAPAAYGANNIDAKHGDLPVEQPTKFDLFINLTAAKAFGLTIPPSPSPVPTG